MFGMKKNRFHLGEVHHREVNHKIDEAIEKQQEIKKSWATRRPKTLAVSNPKTEKEGEPIAVLPKKPSSIFNDDSRQGFIGTYWFPLLCIAAVLSVAIWTFWPAARQRTERPGVPEPVVRTVEPAAPAPATNEAARAGQPSASAPSFDIVRIEEGGSLVIAGRAGPRESVSISINRRIVATVAADARGEFVHTPKSKFRPGNYVIQLVAGDRQSDRVFVYVSERADQSLSLLMTDRESRVLQAPKSIAQGAFVVNQIDYLANGRLVVQGRGLPRLRASLTLDDTVVGMTRISDAKNFGIGANVGELKPGREYTLTVRMHDSAGTAVNEIKHRFTMPEMTDANETFYVVRRGDTLWVIARNYLGRGFQFTAIASANNIENPDLIFPNQRFRIPVK